jgi:hypothetical protein
MFAMFGGTVLCPGFFLRRGGEVFDPSRTRTALTASAGCGVSSQRKVSAGTRTLDPDHTGRKCSRRRDRCATIATAAKGQEVIAALPVRNIIR